MYNAVSNIVQRYIESGLYKYHEDEAKSVIVGMAYGKRSQIDSDVQPENLNGIRLMFVMYTLGCVSQSWYSLLKLELHLKGD